MRARLPWVLFGLSLAANLFFVGGVLYSARVEERLVEQPEARLAFVAEQLGLSEDQRAGLLDLRARIQGRRESTLEQRDRMRAELLSELAQPEFDRDRWRALIDAYGEQRGAYMAEVAEELHGYLTGLSPPQREQFLAMARERGFLRRLFGRSDTADEGR